MKIMSLLKAETKAYHAKLESLPYFSQLIAHRLPLECYVNQLRALSVIHSILEEQLAASVNEQVALVWEDGLRKLPLLMEDLHFFEPRFSADNTPCIEIALSIAEKIRLRSVEQPLSLLGYLYVMEGSTLGNYMHQPDITTSYHLEGLDGSRYYSSYQADIKLHWQQFAGAMNGVLDAPVLHAPVKEAAHEAFAGLDVLYTALFPIKKSENTMHAVRINPEAGNHPIPSDSREIEAALTASNRCWKEYLYYEKRYGTRGKRFSDSDTCWLATLTALDQIDVQKQVDWLCRVLATRGMPSLMLETTLDYLSFELTAAIPANKALYHKLLTSSATLQKKRLQRIEQKAFNKLAQEFEQSVGTDMSKALSNTGVLLISAVIDEANGIQGALSGLQKWLVDADRFSRTWIAAVEQTVSKVQSIVS